MPKKSKTLLDHANELATELAEKVGPQVEHAMETAKEKAGPVIAEARAWLSLTWRSAVCSASPKPPGPVASGPPSVPG